MINLYAYSYPAALREFADNGLMLAKIGDSHREAQIRIAEQGGASEWEGKVTIGVWPNLKKIKRDFRVHEVLTERGLWHKTDNLGNEWFKIPAESTADMYNYIDKLVLGLEGERARPVVKLRNIQQRLLDKAMEIIKNAKGNISSLIANLCPRFGKTIWALMLFNRISKKYGNRVMLLPAYWLSVHTSFDEEIGTYKDFNDIRVIDITDPDSYKAAWSYIEQGLRIVVPISLHGDYNEWCNKHSWIASIPNEEIFMFADEGDFGTHAPNQVAKLDFLFKN